jgi:hypothetical protein
MIQTIPVEQPTKELLKPFTMPSENRRERTFAQYATLLSQKFMKFTSGTIGMMGGVISFRLV